MYVNGKMRPVETVPGMGLRGKRRDKGEGREGGFKYDIF
jgi:hypothetical protein